jgi:hypothetical protein
VGTAQSRTLAARGAPDWEERKPQGRVTGEIAVIRTIPPEALLFFDRTAAGETAPLRTIVGALTRLNGPSLHSYFPWLVFADGFEAGTGDGWSVTVD